MAVQKPPYAFVPVPTDAEGRPAGDVEPPMFHDGSSEDSSLLSGELHCTLTALTPILVANDQYNAEDALGAKSRHGDEPVYLPGGWGIQYPVKYNKKVLEPLRLSDGRVALPGSGFKGMLRQSLGGLLAAPMERVGERTYGYRPNLGFVAKNPRREPRPAIVDRVEGDTVTLKVLPRFECVVFVRGNVMGKLGRLRPGDPAQGWIPDVKLEGRPPRRRLVIRKDAGERLAHTYFRYFGGIDGRGDLARAFAENSHVQVYKHVLVEAAALKQGASMVLPSDVVAAYVRTQAHLADTSEGHLRGEHPLTGKLINTTVGQVAAAIGQLRNAIRTPGTLIYVELENDPAGRPRIVSVGHNFYYYWRYADTVRTRSGSNISRPRPILQPLPAETTLVGDDKDPHRPPCGLSGARLLFGYVAADADSGTHGVGKGDFERLAGRLAFNIGVEVLPDAQNPADDRRFVNGDRGAVVALKILGPPRPSAMKEYLDQSRRSERQQQSQDSGTLVTYGDLAGEISGELRGRKFYRHQPAAAADPSCYEATDKATIAGDQAGLARFVSPPGSRFRFALRFRDLRPWELGAVLAGLEPGRLLRAALADAPEDTELKRLEGTPGSDPLFALKLGHGRPLGLGSVTIEVDAALRLTSAGDLQVDAALTDAAQDALAARLGSLNRETVAAWLDVHRYRGRNRAEYPRGGEKNTVYGHYTEQRRQHVVGRRRWPKA